MLLKEQDLKDLDKVKRLNIINSVSGIKPANLIGTVDKAGQSNLAIFSSVVHLGSNPALLGFMLRPEGEVRRHTFENIMETKFFTINHVHESFIKQAHYTSAKFEKEVSEFDRCALTEDYIEDFKAPFVKESHLKLGMEFVQQIPLEINGTSMIIGKVKMVIVPEESMSENGRIDLSQMSTVGISGLNTYYSLKKMEEFPYVRVQEVPEFK